MTPYNPGSWYWIVAGDESRAWSSAAGAYVAQYPSDAVTRIANEVELYDVLAKAGLSSKAPAGPYSADKIRDALVRIDAEATGNAADAASLSAVASEIGLHLPPISG